VVQGFDALRVESAGGIVLKTVSEPPISRPTPSMDDQPAEEMNVVRGLGLLQFPCSQDKSLNMEESHVGRASCVRIQETPLPHEAVRHVRLQGPIIKTLAKVEVGAPDTSMIHACFGGVQATVVEL
jgi:hypothetical protein